MKSAVTAWLVVALTLGAAPARRAPHPVESMRISGVDYVRLASWAYARKLDLRWARGTEALLLSNPMARFTLVVDRRETRINGVEVWLLFPVLMRNENVYVAQLDLQNTFLPILSPPKSRRGMKVRTVCLDPGHGGKDSGNRVGANQEKSYTLLLAQEVRQQLVRQGIKVILTRTTDAFIELPGRPEVAARRGADLFVSLHFNSAESSRDTVHGAEVYCLTPAGAPSTNARGEGGSGGACPGNRFNDRNFFFAYQMQRAVTRFLGTEDRGLRRARFAVLRDAAMPAALIEAGFMSHPTEGQRIFTAAYRQKMAEAIVEGVLAYKRQVEL